MEREKVAPISISRSLLNFTLREESSERRLDYKDFPCEWNIIVHERHDRECNIQRIFHWKIEKKTCKRKRKNEGDESIRGTMKISRSEYKYEGLKDVKVGGYRV